VNARRPPSLQTTSVNVPPTSAPTRVTADRSRGSPRSSCCVFRSTRATPACSRGLARQQPGDRVDRPLRRLVDRPLRLARVARLARLVEAPVVRDRPPEALSAREHDPVVPLGAQEETFHLGDEARTARSLVAG